MLLWIMGHSQICYTILSYMNSGTSHGTRVHGKTWVPWMELEFHELEFHELKFQNYLFIYLIFILL